MRRNREYVGGKKDVCVYCCPPKIDVVRHVALFLL